MTFEPYPTQSKRIVNLETYAKTPTSLSSSIVANFIVKVATIGTHYKSQTPPFLLTFKIFNHNMHN